jgi:predicted small integral membrane protein
MILGALNISIFNANQNMTKENIDYNVFIWCIWWFISVRAAGAENFHIWSSKTRFSIGKIIIWGPYFKIFAPAALIIYI